MMPEIRNSGTREALRKRLLHRNGSEGYSHDKEYINNCRITVGGSMHRKRISMQD